MKSDKHTILKCVLAAIVVLLALDIYIIASPSRRAKVTSFFNVRTSPALAK
ncbi:MAG: hypothetical protein IJG84_25860 [Kiritimatiellae bacterium]|nr:hypothetical protein [Kiritimatiellia bacterium]